LDNQDYVLWRKTLGNVVELFDRADGNGSGTVDPNDYSIWRLNFGAAPGAGLGNTGSVPEPAAAWLLLIAICSRSCGRRLRRR
jgi:hypothetical protein